MRLVRATSLNIIEHGINYTSALHLIFLITLFLKQFQAQSQKMKHLQANISGATGTVIDFTAPLLKYTATTSSLVVGDTVTFSGDGNCCCGKI